MKTNLKITSMRVAELTPYIGNAKQHPSWQIEQIAESIEAFGFNDPIAYADDVAGHHVIIEGHGRYYAAKLLELEEVPVICLNHLDDEARRAYTLVHNQLTINTGFDLDKLQLELEAIEGYDMTEWGFEDLALKAFEEVDPEEVAVPEEVEKRAKRGDIWQLGDHRLMCGSAADENDMKRLFTERPVLCVTDPPYNVAIGSKNKTLKQFHKGGIEEDLEGDKISSAEHLEMLFQAFTNLRLNMDSEASYYIFTPPGGDMPRMAGAIERAGIPYRHTLIWVKNVATFSIGRLDYDYRHEPIIYTWTDKHKFYGGYSTSVIEDTKRLEAMSKEELKELVRALKNQKDESVIYADKPMASKLHPTMKPVKLIARLITNSSQRGDLVADIFGGSGTTLLAAEQLARRCYMMELDPHYCDVILTRWEEYTGRRAELVE